MMSDTSIIIFKDVSFSYGSTPILQDVNLIVGEREIVYIVGPNGGGKTTLLKLVLGLLRPSKGEVRVFGEPPEHIRHRIGYTPQYIHFDPKFPVTVLDIVLMGRLGSHSGGPYRKSDKAAVWAVLNELELSAIANQLFAELSGGLRQRVLIARALAGSPDMLLLDEPTANVDIHTENKLMDIIKELNERMTILMVSHDLGFVSDLVKSVVCVNRQVRVHPTGDITGDAVRNIYEKDMRLIRHDLTLENQGFR